MKIKTMVLALGLVASVTSFAQSGDSAQNNTSSTANMTNPYTTGVNRYLSPNQITEVQNMIQGMILQNNTSINQQFSVRDQKDADLQNQINSLKNSGVSMTLANCTFTSSYSSSTYPSGAVRIQFSSNSSSMAYATKYICMNGNWVHFNN